VVLVAESAGLAAVLNQLLDPADRLSRLGSLRELAESRSLDTADVVVLDVPAEERAAAVGQIRRRYLGPLVILVTKGEPIAGLRLDDACGLLFRPFSVDELGETLGAPGRSSRRPPGTVTAATASGGTPPSSNGPGAAGVAAVPAVAAARRSPGPGKPGVELPPPDPDGAPVTPKPPDPKASARQAPVRPAPPGPPGLVERGQRLLIALTQGWQARRRVRVAGFSVFALVAFTAAFALAAQGGRCGPGCDAFGTVFSPDPTVAPASSRPPSTTGPKNSTTTTAPSGSLGSVYRGVSGGRVATTTTRVGAGATTTSKKPATTRPATTRPATTAPPTTAPPTTAPPTTAPPTTAPPTTVGA
jgi:hypothetical protein